MKKVLLLTAIFLTFIRPVNAGLVETYFDYAPTSTVTSVNLNGNFDNIRNVLNGGITGDNVDSPNGWRLVEILSSPPAAGNQGRVVFDSSTNTLKFDTGSDFITTAVLPNNQTFTGSNTFSGSVTTNGSFTANGTTNTIGNGGSDTLTLNVPGGITWTTGAGTWTLSGALTFSGTIADLGTVTTANIDGGTLDGVQIGGTTATGELIVNDSNDDADGLGSQGTSGQILTSQGAGVNPAFANNSRSNVIFAWAGWDAQSGSGGGSGIYIGTDQTPNSSIDTQNVFVKRTWANTANYGNMLAWKWTKVVGINTLTVNVRAWCALTDVTDAFVRLDVNNGTTGTSSDISASTTPAWQTAFTVDVSGLSNGTTYDMEIQAGTTDATGSADVYVSVIIIEGS